MSFKAASIVLAVAASLFYGVIFLQETWDTQLIPDALAPVFALAIVLPFAIWIHALIAAGRQEARVDKDGSHFGRLRLGVRLFFWGTGVVLLYLFGPALLGVTVPPFEENDIVFQSGIWWSTLGILFILLWASLYALKAEIRWDTKSVSITSVFFYTKRRNWIDLSKTAYEDLGNTETKLRFERAGSLKVSKFFEGHDDLIAYAKERLENT